MTLITNPDQLSQGTVTSLSAAWTSSAATETTITASATLPVYIADDYFEVRDHSVSGNNGLYRAKGSPTASELVADKIDGVNPANAGSEAIRLLHTNTSASTKKSVMVDTGQKRIYLLEQGNLSSDGVTEQALYSFLKEEWKVDDDLIKAAFPIVPITPEQFEFSDGWEPRNVTSPAIRSKKLIRTGGWSEVNTDGNLANQYMGVITLGNFEDNDADIAYYQLGNDPTDTSAAVAFTFPGPVNESVLVFSEIGNPPTCTFATSATITRASGSFITDGYKKGGRVTIRAAGNSSRNGTFVLTNVETLTLTVTGATFTTGTDGTAMLSVDNRNAVTTFLRVRDADPTGKTFDSINNSSIGFATVDNKAFRFPLSNAADLNITGTDVSIAADSPYTEIKVRYFNQSFNREVDSATNRNFGIVIDVGTHSGVDGSAPGSGSILTTATGGMGINAYAGGTLRIHEGTDENLTFPVVSNDATTITVTGTIASGTNLSFTAQRATPVVASKTAIYEKIQYLLRQSSDIDSTSSVITGKTANGLLVFVGSDLKCGSLTPTNPNGGGSGVIIEGFSSGDTNNLFFYDNLGESRNYPYIAAGTISFNSNLTADSAPEFWTFFTYISRTTVSDFAIASPSGSTASITSSGNLPTVATNDYFRLTDMVNEANNGIWVVTDAAPTTSQFDARKVDGLTVVAETSASHPVDLKPVDSPQAVIVNDSNAASIAGSIVGASRSFTFDYDGNTQGGRTAGTNAPITIRAIGLETGQFAEVTGTITRATGLNFSIVSALERNYSNV